MASDLECRLMADAEESACRSDSSSTEPVMAEVSRTTSASSTSDRSQDEESWWASMGRSTDPLCVSRSNSSQRSDEFNFAEFDLSKAKLPLDESWWVPLAEDTMRIAEDIAQGSCPIPSKLSSIEQWPGKIWKKLRRYRCFVLFVSLVTLINGLFSILLLECFLGTSKVCMFGSCHSPYYLQSLSQAYDRTTLNMTASSAQLKPGPNTVTPQVYTDEDDDLLLNAMSKDWEVAPHPSVPRAYVLDKKQGHYRALLVQDICYLFMQGTGAEHGRATGVWFDADAIEAVRTGDSRSFLDARELHKLDVLQTLVAPWGKEASSVHKGAFRWTADMYKVQRKINRTVGSFVGPKGLADYLELSSNTALRHLRESEEPAPGLIGIVGGTESNIASFSTHSVFFSELANPPSGLWHAASVFFPGDRKVWSPWTEGALKAAVGSRVSAVAGQKQGQPFCFRNTLFLINERPAASVEIDNFRLKAWAIADSGVSFFKKAGHLLPDCAKPAPPLSLVQKLVDTAEEEVRLQMGLSNDVARTAQYFRHLAKSSRKYQITVLVDSVGKELLSKKIANLPVLMALVKKMFPRLEVQAMSLAESSFIEQVAALKRTVLLIAPYGTATGSAMFLPRGASIIEVFPFMFRSEATTGTARAAGLSYFKWENEVLSNSKYDEDCLVKNNFVSLSASECRRHRPCLFCVRDHASTTVDRKGFRAVLLTAQKPVRSFLEASKAGRSEA